jgi:hypothetical protein
MWCVFHREYAEPIWLNTQHIVSIEKESETTTRLGVSGYPKPIVVRGIVGDVLQTVLEQK